MTDAIMSGLLEGEPQPTNKSEVFCNKLRFLDLCHALEDLDSKKGTRSKDDKFKILFPDQLMRDLRNTENESIYPLVRLVMPNIDGERARCGLKESALAKTYIDALTLSSDSAAAMALKNFNKAEAVQKIGATSGDFAGVLMKVMDPRGSSEGSNATLGDINQLLDDLALALNSDAKVKIMKERVVRTFSAFEQKWLVRLILGELKMGLKHESILNFLGGPRLKDRYNNCGNLRIAIDELDMKTCSMITSSCMGVELFSKPKPMLADGDVRHHRLGLFTATEQQMEGQPFYIDEKLDGERLIVHVKDGEVFMHSRNGIDYTQTYHSIGESVKNSINASSVILDGEILAWDAETLPSANGKYIRQYMKFGSVKSIANEERDARDREDAMDVDDGQKASRWLVYVCFDILYVDGPSASAMVATAGGVVKPGAPVGSILHLPLCVRRKVLKQVVRPIPTKLQFVISREVRSTDVGMRRQLMEEFFNDVVESGGEGVVVKNAMSKYEFGERKAGWVKLKPEYGGMASDLDFLVLGAHYGTGKSVRAMGVSKFTLGVPHRNPLTGEVVYYTCCRVATGYNYAQLAKLRQLVAERGRPWPTNGTLPPGLAPWPVAAVDRPDYYIPPKDSFVMQIKCGELTVCERNVFSARVTTRFPRVERIRYDKGADDVMTLEELVKLADAGVHNGEGKKDVMRSPRSVQKRVVREAVDAAFTTNASYTVGKGGIFAGMTFCVVDGTDFVDRTAEGVVRRYTKKEVEGMIHSNGGAVFANPEYQSGSATRVIVGQKTNISTVVTCIGSGHYDVIDFGYILDCVRRACVRPPTSLEYVGLSRATRQALGSALDVLDVR